MDSHTNKTVKFSEIIEYAKNLQKKASCSYPLMELEEHYRGYYSSDVAVMLRFTLHGDYIGSTIEKSNYSVVIEQLKSLYKDNFNSEVEYTEFSIFDNDRYYRYLGSYSSEALLITDDLPLNEWELIKDMAESYADYPLLDEDYYSIQQEDDVWQSWLNWQYYDVFRTLRDDYDLDLDDTLSHIPNIEQWLWGIINDYELIPEVERIEILEVNSCSYMDFDEDNTELFSQLKTAILDSI